MLFLLFLDVAALHWIYRRERDRISKTYDLDFALIFFRSCSSFLDQKKKNLHFKSFWNAILSLQFTVTAGIMSQNETFLFYDEILFLVAFLLF